MSIEPPNPPPAPVKTNWLVFYVLLLAPAVLTMLISPKSPSAGYVLFGGVAMSGIGCGLMMSRRVQDSDLARGLCFLLFAPVFGFLSLCLCIVGCTLVHGGLRS